MWIHALLTRRGKMRSLCGFTIGKLLNQSIDIQPSRPLLLALDGLEKLSETNKQRDFFNFIL
jgi:hypothetical protein